MVNDTNTENVLEGGAGLSLLTAALLPILILSGVLTGIDVASVWTIGTIVGVAIAATSLLYKLTRSKVGSYETVVLTLFILTEVVGTGISTVYIQVVYGLSGAMLVGQSLDITELERTDISFGGGR